MAKEDSDGPYARERFRVDVAVRLGESVPILLGMLRRRKRREYLIDKVA